MVTEVRRRSTSFLDSRDIHNRETDEDGGYIPVVWRHGAKLLCHNRILDFGAGHGPSLLTKMATDRGPTQ